MESEIDKLIRHLKWLFAFLVMGAMVVLAWNILAIVLQFLGFRFYPWTLTTCAVGFGVPIVVIAPGACVLYSPMPWVGILIIVVSACIALAVLRFEAGQERGEEWCR
jgi:hypothetical protein